MFGFHMARSKLKTGKGLRCILLLQQKAPLHSGRTDYYNSRLPINIASSKFLFTMIAYSSAFLIHSDSILHLHFFFFISIDPLHRLPAISSFHVADLLVGLRGWKARVDESVPMVVQVGDSVPDGVVMSRSSSSRRSSSLGGTGAILFPRRRRCPGCSCTPSRGQGPRRSRHRCCSDFQIYFISYFNSRVVAVVASSNLKKSPELVLPPSSWCCSRSLGSWRARGSW